MIRFWKVQRLPAWFEWTVFLFLALVMLTASVSGLRLPATLDGGAVRLLAVLSGYATVRWALRPYMKQAIRDGVWQSPLVVCVTLAVLVAIFAPVFLHHGCSSYQNAPRNHFQKALQAYCEENAGRTGQIFLNQQDAREKLRPYLEREWILYQKNTSERWIAYHALTGPMDFLQKSDTGTPYIINTQLQGEMLADPKKKIILAWSSSDNGSRTLFVLGDRPEFLAESEWQQVRTTLRANPLK